MKHGLGRWRIEIRKAVTMAGAMFAFSVLVFGTSYAVEEESPNKAVRLKTIKVTANKMEENLKDVPQSITVIDEIEIEEKGIKNIAGVIDNMPGMSHGGGPEGISVNFRGLNSSAFTLNNPVTIYVDGVAHSGMYGFDASMINVERVEVLRGPQSTLYGKDAMGAVINVISKDPTNEWQGKVGAEYGTCNAVDSFLGMNGPIVDDTFFLGLSGQYTRDDGWIKNDYPDMEEDANRKRGRKVNGYLLVKPNDDLRVRLSANHMYKKGYFGDKYVLPPGASLDDFDAANAKHVRYDVPNWEKMDYNAQSLNIGYSFGDYKFDSISTHKILETKGIFDRDGMAVPAYAGLTVFDNSEEEAWAQEFRISNGNPHEFRWMCGLFGEISNRKQGPYGIQFPMAGAPWEMDAYSDQDAHTLAAFGQLMVPFGSGFELTLGGRLQRLHKEMNLKVYMNPIGAPNLHYSMETEKTWNAFLPKAALSYAFNEEWTTYVSYTHGYMPGGFNNFADQGTVEDNTFKPQKSKNYELGLKADYDNLRMGVALFYMDIKDIHVFKSVGTMWQTDNAKKAHSYGAEFEAVYSPVATVQLSGSVSLIKAKYDDYDAGKKRYDRENIQKTPSHTIRLGMAYHAPWGFYARVDGRYIGSKSYYNDFKGSFDKADAYAVIDTKVGYRINNFDIYAYSKNLTDEEYVTSFSANGVKTELGVGAPRTFGAGVMYYF